MATVRKIPKAEEEEKPPTIADIFGPRGLLERCLGAGYEHRRSQLEMAEIVEEAFQNKRHALVEAGTGTGKTLAYLLPAIRSGRRVVVSTATKSLQEQLFTKDVPFLQKHFAPELKVAVMKGPRQFSVPAKIVRHGGSAGAEGFGRGGLVRADARLGESDRDRRSQ
jgi:ATP-dependent DNA helicase DinG